MTKAERLGKAKAAQAARRAARSRADAEGRDALARHLAGTSWDAPRGPMSAAERQRRHRDRERDVSTVEIAELFKKANKSRRARCRRSLLAFLTEYCTDCDGGFLESAPDPAGAPDMIRIIENIQEALEGSRWYHVRIPRGHGKTSFVKGGIAWALAYGIRRFVVAVGATAAAAGEIVADVHDLFARSERLRRDFPEYAAFFDRVRGTRSGSASLTCDGIPTRFHKNAREFQLPRLPGPKYAHTGGILQAAGFSANARGKVKGSLRPDMVLFDDLQDEETAERPERVAKAVKNIEKNFLNLGGHTRNIAALMTSTPIQPDDLSETFASKPTWKTSTFVMLKAWPKDMKLWAEYNAIRQRETIREDGGDPAGECLKFYLAHRAEMDEGAVVLNPANYDRDSEASGVQHAMNKYFNGEDQFMSEYQMRPRRFSSIVNITPQLVLSRVRPGVPMGTIPPGTVRITAATDINESYALSTVLVAWRADMTAFVPAWWMTPCKIDVNRLGPTQYEGAIFDALAAEGRRLRDMGIPIDRWGVDAGGDNSEAVKKFAVGARAVGGVGCVPMYGRAKGTFPRGKPKNAIQVEMDRTYLCSKPEPYGDKASGYGVKYILWDSGYHHEKAHLAWKPETLSPGGISLFDGGRDVSHDELAVQTCDEYLAAKQHTPWGDAYDWRSRGGKHDLGDALAMNYALAAGMGISAGAVTAEPARKAANPAARNLRIRRW